MRLDAFSLLTGQIRTHVNGGVYDRIVVSEAINRGTSGLQLNSVIAGEHAHGKEAIPCFTRITSRSRSVVADGPGCPRPGLPGLLLSRNAAPASG